MWHRTPPKPFPPVPRELGGPTVEQARAEQRASTHRFIEAAHQGPEVRRVSAEMRERRIQNGFEDLLDAALQKRQEKHP